MRCQVKSPLFFGFPIWLGVRDFADVRAAREEPAGRVPRETAGLTNRGRAGSASATCLTKRLKGRLTLKWGTACDDFV